MIFWRNQTVDNIFSWSQQCYLHIDPLEQLCSQNMFFTLSSFVNSIQVNDIFSPRRSLDIYTERISPSLCLWGWLLGWIHLVDPWDLLMLHQGTEPSTSEVLRRCIVHERRSTRPLFQIYTIRNWKQSMKNSFKHFIKLLACKLYINPKNYKKNNTKMFYLKKHKNNLKYNKFIQLISTLKINHILLHVNLLKN